MSVCSCGFHQDYSQCCGIFLEHKTPAPTPEKLMRSRYTAYTRADIPYIQKTMCGKAVLHFNAEKAEKWARSVYWLGLEVIRAQDNLVEFKASFLEKNTVKIIHEISSFEYIDGCWFYIDGEQITEPVVIIARNAACPCGSKRKFKNCHGA